MIDSSSVSQLESAISTVLSGLGEDMNREGIHETPHRYTKQIEESLCGYADDPKQHVKLFKNTHFGGLVTVAQVSFSSICEHHLLPFFGYVDIAYVPKKNILGLSKFARIVDSFSKRLQVQERLTHELADFFAAALEPELMMVKIRAKHTCMITRGVLRPESYTDTSAIIGDTITYSHHVASFNQSTAKRAL